MKVFIVLFSLVFFIGCASTSMMRVRVESIPSGAQVDVNGINMGNSPTEVDMGCPRTWVGVMNSPEGWAYGSANYEITVYPSTTNPGYSQTKNINPCQWRGGTPPVIRFDLGLEKVTPTQKVEIKNKPAYSDSQTETLRTLKKLRDQGLLSEAEYKEKVLRVVEQNDQ